MGYFGIPIRNGLPIGLGSLVGFGIRSFEPSELFAAGEQGTWYDPSDFSTLFQDSAGTTPVTGVEQVVGRMLDKSGRGNHATATGSARPTLSARVNRLLSTETLATQNVTTVAATYTLYFTGTGSITLSGTATGTYSAGSNTVTCTAGTLTLTVSGAVTTADLRVTNDGVGIPAYQRVNTATDYDTAGFPVYLAFGGAQAMSTPANVDFSGTDKMTVFAGVRKLSDAARGMFAELGNDVTQSFQFNAPSSAAPQYSFASRGSAPASAAVYTNAAVAAPVTNVATGIGNISGDSSVLRINGSEVATNTADQGTGNYGSYPLFIGARNLASLFFTGRLYSLITRGATTDSASVAATEAWVNQRTAAY